nr:hypothetical protein [Tanacetum cinerariifolium]
MGTFDDWKEVTYKKNRSTRDRFDLPLIQELPNTGRFRTKEDDVAKISVSVFITNFLESCSAKDLFNHCKQYGYVVDSFIPNKRSKAGKRFGFVRFINVFNKERLVDNLATVWIGRSKLQANFARFVRSSSRGGVQVPSKVVNNDGSSNVNAVKVPARHNGTSFASVLQGNEHLRHNISPPLALVLDETYVVDRDFAKCVMGKIKTFSSFPNLYSILLKEGFQNIVWVDIEGVPLHAWSRATFTKICSKWGEVMELKEDKDDSFARKRVKEVEYCSDDESLNGEEVPQCDDNIIPNVESDSDIDAVSDACFGESGGNLDGDIAIEQPVKDGEHSSDPFGIYGILGKKDTSLVISKVDKSLPFPPDFTPLSPKAGPIEQGSNGKAKSIINLLVRVLCRILTILKKIWVRMVVDLFATRTREVPCWSCWMVSLKLGEPWDFLWKVAKRI